MGKQFVTNKEKEIIMKTYSRSAGTEFEKIGPYTFKTKYAYTINMCPELDDKGNDTGRILVNHFTVSLPFYIDVWGRVDGELRFLSRNLPTTEIYSLEAEVEALKQEIEVLKHSEEFKGSLKGKKLSEYCRYVTGQRDYLIEAYDHISKRNSNYLAEKDAYFKESETYWDLLSQRDDALRDKARAENEAKYAKERLREVTEHMLALNRELQELKKNTPTETPRNPRNAGRKKDPNRAEKRQKILELKAEGRSVKDIIEIMGISRTTFYRLLKGTDN